MKKVAIFVFVALAIISVYYVQARPTIEPTPDFDPQSDAKAIRGALKGFGTNDKRLINIIAARTNFERLQIAQAYKALYARDIINDIKGDTTGKFQDILVALMTPGADYDAKQLRKSIKGLGTDYNLLIEILLTRNPRQLEAIKEAYNRLYKRDLIQSIKGDTNRKVQDLLVKIASGTRDQSGAVDPEAARRDAQALIGGRSLFGSNSKFTDILANNNFNQLRLIFEQYERISKRNIGDDIKKQTSGKYEKALLILVDVVANPGNYFATRLRKAIKGLGTNTDDLTRILATRSEIDLQDIKDEYRKKYKNNLEKDIKGDTNRKYQDTLVKLIQGNQRPLEADAVQMQAL